jgi:hypothetical protein
VDAGEPPNLTLSALQDVSTWSAPASALGNALTMMVTVLEDEQPKISETVTLYTVEDDGVAKGFATLTEDKPVPGDQL